VAVPFEVELAPAVVKQLQADKVAAAYQTRQIVSDLSYLGDEGGIMCHIVPPENEAAIIVPSIRPAHGLHNLWGDRCQRAS
jgi:hypothetical protein